MGPVAILIHEKGGGISIGWMQKSLKRCDRGNSDVHESSVKEESK